MLAYLCGPIDFAPDGGNLWRRTLTSFSHNDLGHRVYVPAKDEKKNFTAEACAALAGMRVWEPPAAAGTQINAETAKYGRIRFSFVDDVCRSCGAICYSAARRS